MADLGPAILGIVGTAIGGVIAAGAGFVQARSQERIEQNRLEHELQRADEERRAVAEGDYLERQRAALFELVDVATAIARGGATNDLVTRVRGLTYQVDDAVLRRMAERDMWYRQDEFFERIGYLLRTNVDTRTDDGHMDARDDTA